MDEKNKKLFVEMYLMILSDINVHPKELEALYSIGKKQGISEDEIRDAVFSQDKIVEEEELSNDEKIEHLYCLSQLAYADDIVKDAERAVLQNAAKRLGFIEENIEKILVFLLEQAKEKKSFNEVLSIIKNS
ncbi:MAG: hypothetical protein LBG17_06905 [Bacteroidales bacterium]|jgi:uncharacterized tellurite resistance protein B-like protein|nr:hypothetical protein [Bacteroidales bacterium]